MCGTVVCDEPIITSLLERIIPRDIMYTSHAVWRRGGCEFYLYSVICCANSLMTYRGFFKDLLLK
jgi:hypothetical protein